MERTIDRPSRPAKSACVTGNQSGSRLLGPERSSGCKFHRAFVTAAPFDKIESLRERMGWNHIRFYSLPDERFSRDFGVEDLFGINVFIRRGETIFRTYFLNGRGIEEIGPVWSFLDMTLRSAGDLQQVPPGRPQGDPYTWWRLHDNYGEVAAPNPPQSKGDA